LKDEKKKKKYEKIPYYIPNDHPSMRGSFEDRIDQRHLLPRHLAWRVLTIYRRARWAVHKIYRKYQEQKDKRLGFK
jgi:hypothetical protein